MAFTLFTVQRMRESCRCACAERANATQITDEKEKEKEKDTEKSEKDPSKSSAVRRPLANAGIFIYEVESVKDSPPFVNVPSVIQ